MQCYICITAEIRVADSVLTDSCDQQRSWVTTWSVLFAEIKIVDSVLTNSCNRQRSYVNTWSVMFARVISAIIRLSAIICERGLRSELTGLNDLSW